MRIEKAIEIKEIYYNGGEIPSHSDYREADRLSIEAIKRVQWHKAQHERGFYELLPGETED